LSSQVATFSDSPRAFPQAGLGTPLFIRYTGYLFLGLSGKLGFALLLCQCKDTIPVIFWRAVYILYTALQINLCWAIFFQ